MSEGGTSPATESPVVLVVEDERDLARFYVEWLEDDYGVRTAHDGEQALEQLDDDVDAVLLDRRMQGLSGREVLAEIRERGIDCRVAMVTAVDPDFDIVGMGFDDYLVKPVTRGELRETVDRLLRLAAFDEQFREHFALVSKKALLEVEKSPAELQASEEYDRLQERLDEMDRRLESTIDRLGDTEFNALFREPGWATVPSTVGAGGIGAGAFTDF